MLVYGQAKSDEKYGQAATINTLPYRGTGKPKSPDRTHSRGWIRRNVKATVLLIRDETKTAIDLR